MNNSLDYNLFFDIITQYSLIISSSLHGIIFADAYKIACIPVSTFNSKVSSFKFYDYFSTNENRRYYKISNLEELIKMEPREFKSFILPEINDLESKQKDMQNSIEHLFNLK